MAATPQGPGWWQATDGQWYPPETHPEHRTSGAEPAPNPGPGWWMAADGNLYPPETHPAHDDPGRGDSDERTPSAGWPLALTIIGIVIIISIVFSVIGYVKFVDAFNSM